MNSIFYLTFPASRPSLLYKNEAEAARRAQEASLGRGAHC